MYYRNPNKKHLYNYILPFLIIAIIFGVIFYGWHALNNIFIDKDRNTLNEKVFLNIESGSAKAMTVGKNEWQNAPDKIYLYRGERLRSATDGRVTLTFFDQSIMRLDTDTEVGFTSLKKKNDTNNIEVQLAKGNAWVKVERINNPSSTFNLTTDLLILDTRGAIFSVTYPGTVYVLDGNVQIGVKYNDNVIKTYNVGIGQQFVIDETMVQSLQRGDTVETIFALSDTFKKTNWYIWNMKKDGAINAFEESDIEDTETVTSEGTTTDTTSETTSTISETSVSNLSSLNEEITDTNKIVYVTNPSKNFETNKSSISIAGNYDAEKISAIYINGVKANLSDGKWSISSVKLIEGENKIKIDAQDLNGVKTTLSPLVIIYDKTPPEKPVITEPSAKQGEVVSIDDVEQLIEGTVSKDTQAVIVNDYRLSKYVPGSQKFTYYAKVQYGNLQEGENEFKVYAEDKAGNLSDPAIITLKLDKEVIDKAKSEEATSDTSETSSTASNLPQASSSGGVKIASPNLGKSFTTTETEFEITGIVPEGTSKVVVNDYPLSLFKAGDNTFKYRAYASIGNLKIGEKNVFTVIAYDENDNKLGEASITIDVQSGASAAPVITIPNSNGSYSTTLDTIVIGGTVGKWVTHMYVNDKEIKDYIPGSEKWTATVNLVSGENTFVVNAEKDGESVGKATIKINYQQ